jgi:hypothetical protein
VSEAAAALQGQQLRGGEARINLDDVFTHDAVVSQLGASRQSVSESPASQPLRADLPLALAPSQSLRSTPLLGPDFAHTEPVRRRGSWMIWVGGLVLLMLSAAAACLVQMGQMPLPEFLAQQLNERGIEIDLSSPQPPPPQPPRGAWVQQSEPGIPRLLVQGSRGIIGEPVLLGVTLEGQAEGAVVMITRLVPGMKLSTGAAVGANTWQVPATDLAHTWISAPNDFVGVVDLMVELHLADTTTVDRRPIHFEWAAATPVIASAGPTIAPEPPAVAPELPVVASEPPAVASEPPTVAPLLREAAPGPLQLDADEIAILVTRGKEFIANGDLAGARLVLQRAAESKDAQAALVLGATYDPVILRALKVYGLAADIAMARMWYEKAKEFGSAEAPRRLQILASGAR